MSRRQTFAIIGLLSLLSSCATQRIVYQKEGVTEEQRKQDQAICVRAAIGAEGRFLDILRIDRDVYAQCMENRGYVAHRQ